MTTESRFSVLFRKYVEASATQEERLEFLALANQEAQQSELAQLVDEEIKLKGTAYSLTQQEQDEILTRIYNAPQEATSQTPIFQLWKRIALVAAAVAVIVFGVWFYTGSPVVNPKPEIVTQNDLAPGKHTATLTLANGKTITLSDAKTGVNIDANKLTYNDGSAVEREDPNASRNLKAAAALTITTPRGGQYQIRLPDGTKVWLNAASKLTYSTMLKERGVVRMVSLSGEAYFEVFRNKKQPFVVKSKKMEVTVLGTHFNVNAYEDEVTRTTLLEGSVRVSSLHTKNPATGATPAQQSKILIPGCEAVNTDQSIELYKVDPQLTIAWKNGKFRFDNASLEEVMKQFARWYDVEIVYPEGIPDRKFTGDINRNVNASEALSLLEFTKVKFQIIGKKIIVNK